MASSLLTSDSPFTYREITLDQFRLVRLLPETMSTVKCQIIHASLENPPKYTALSYAWGDADETIKIHLDGCYFNVRKSLHGALKALRQPNESVMLWVDALCINQDNKEELSSQVQVMTAIYNQAESVAVWLGPESDDSSKAVELLRLIYNPGNDVKNLIASKNLRSHFAALVALFERDYWNRLWVVQEVLNAQQIKVHCGNSKLSWEHYRTASTLLYRHSPYLKDHFPAGLSDGTRYSVSQHGLSYGQVLSTQGPASLSILNQYLTKGARSLLMVLHECRRKLAADPRDKVFGVLGILPEDVRYEFRPDYKSSLREVYTNVVDYLLHSTRQLDVVCEAVYFPLYTANSALPTWVPDWSHFPQSGALGLSYEFRASLSEPAEFSFADSQRTRLEISAIYLDSVKARGIAMGTLCGLDDSLMAFLHWRAKFLSSVDKLLREPHGKNDVQRLHEAFCRTLCLDQMGSSSSTRGHPWAEPSRWMATCYHVFASLIRERLPHIPLDGELARYADKAFDDASYDRRRVLQDNCAARMMGRCFFITSGGLMGLGTGFMDPGDVVCVPLGCSTPVLLRPQGGRGEYRMVGDACTTYVLNDEEYQGYVMRRSCYLP
ncbi:heterokaryon incompatibility protein-domain-containing protein [Xylariomycetidae sp. FL2044]|nr:heterokaryon incompatibility protein-domain-containing protein [Xylariomycetidae sp. FL2044]